MIHMTQVTINDCIMFKEKHKPKQNGAVYITLPTNAGLMETPNMGLNIHGHKIHPDHNTGFTQLILKLCCSKPV